MSDGLDPIRTLLGDHAEPTMRTVAAAERRLAAERATPTRPVRQAWWPKVVLPVAAVTALVTAGALLGSGNSSPPSSELSARKILLAAATRAAQAPHGSTWKASVTAYSQGDVQPAPGTDHFTKQKDGTYESNDVPPMAKAASTCEGTVTSGPRGDWATITKSAAHLMSAADVAKWRKEGSPPYAQCNLGVSGRYSPQGPLRARLSAQEYPTLDGQSISARQLAHLPTDPNALKNWLHKFVVDNTDPANGALNWVNDPYQSENFLFEQARDLLFLDPASPNVRAAALKMLAKLPMVRSAGEVKDPLGRPGVSLRLPPPPNTATEINSFPTMQWIINPKTGTLLAAETINQNGHLDQWTAVRQSGWTT